MVPHEIYVSLHEAILRVGAKPVFADIEEANYNLDARLVESLITERTKAIMPVHLFGQAVDMDTLMHLASHYDRCRDYLSFSGTTRGGNTLDRNTSLETGSFPLLIPP